MLPTANMRMNLEIMMTLLVDYSSYLICRRVEHQCGVGASGDPHVIPLPGGVEQLLVVNKRSLLPRQAVPPPRACRAARASGGDELAV